MKRLALILSVLLTLGALPALAATIGDGATRTVTGTVAATEAASGGLVVTLESDKGPLVVGVTLAVGATVTRDGKPIGLSDLSAGEKVTLTYTRRGDRLLGTSVKAKSGKE